VSDFLSACLLLALVTDPIGNLPLVTSMLGGIERQRRVRVVVRECLIAYLILLGFMLGGKTFLALLKLSEESLSIAGGVILFLIALRMVFKESEGALGEALSREPFIVPLAVPLIAGPSALATVMLMASREPAKLPLWIGALTLVMAATTGLLAISGRIERWIGKRTVDALERLMGLILSAMAVEMLLSGIKAFHQGLVR
jgi:MarC family membrane protein